MLQMSRTRKNWRAKLLAALEADDLGTFAAILSEECSSERNYNHQFWHSCLETASKREGGYAFIKSLLEAGFRPRRTCFYTESIHFACQKGHDRNLRALLEDNRTDVNATDSSGRTAFHHLAINFDERQPGYLNCLSLLLSRSDLDVNRPSKKGFTALHEAANRRSILLVRTVLLSQLHLELDKDFANGRTTRDTILESLPSLTTLLPPVRLLIPDAQERLLYFLRKRKLKDFVNILYRVDDDFVPVVNPDHWYESHNTTCLQEAAKCIGSAEYVRYLLRAGANPNIAHPTNGSAALHDAVEKANLPVLELLTQCQRTDVNAANFKGETALHVAMKCHGGTEKCEECLRLVLQHPSVHVNQTDVMGDTPVSLASAKGDEAAVKLLRTHAHNYHALSEDTYQPVKNTNQDIFPGMSKETDKVINYPAIDKLTVKEQLAQFLINYNTQNFLKLFKQQVKSDKDLLDFKIGEETILQFACRCGMEDVVNALLKCGADPNSFKYTSRIPPLILAVVYQRHNIIALLLRHRKKIALNINVTDEQGNTSLYYAGRNEDLYTIIELLRHGANMNLRNVYGKLGLQPKMLANVLDSSITSSGHYVHDADYKLNFDFTPVLSYENEEVFSSVSEEQIWLMIGSAAEPDEITTHSKRKESELEFYNCLSECDEYRDILLHPVVKLFLDIKWSRLKVVFLVRLILYAVFVLLLNMYILMSDMKKVSHLETEIIEGNSEHNLSMADQDEHPAGWSKPKTAFMSFLFLVLFLATMFDTAITMYKIPLKLIKPCRLSVGPGATRRLFRFRRVLDLSVNIFTSVFLYKIKAESIQVCSAVVIILCSWTKLMLLLANFRKPFSNVKIIETLLDRYVPCLLPYYLVVIGFAFCFHILFRDDEYFNSPWTSLFKTTVMMTGEFGINSNMFTLNPVVSHVVFLLFMLLIVIVLMNMLSIFLEDSEEVRKNAQILHILDKVEILSEIESFLLRLLKFKFLSRCFSCSKYVNNWFQNIIVFKENNNKTISVFPNKSKLLQLSDEVLPADIDDNVIKSAYVVINNKHNVHYSSDIKNSLEMQYRLLSELKENQCITQKLIKQFTEANKSHL